MVGRPLLLIVDDDQKYLGYVSRGLEQSGIECVTATNTSSALERLEGAKDKGFDAILLDVMMPGGSGWDFLTDLRSRGVEAPVIFVTARESVNERVKGLRLGADDYIIKPFSFQELLARIEVALRRRSPNSIEIADLEIDIIERVVSRGGVKTELAPKDSSSRERIAPSALAVEPLPVAMQPLNLGLITPQQSELWSTVDGQSDDMS